MRCDYYIWVGRKVTSASMKVSVAVTALNQ